MSVISKEEALALARESDAQTRSSMQALRWPIGMMLLIIVGIVIW